MTVSVRKASQDPGGEDKSEKIAEPVASDLFPSELKGNIQFLVAHVNDSSVKLQTSYLLPIIESNDLGSLPEAAVKSIVKALVNAAILRYTQTQSRYLVARCIGQLVRKHAGVSTLALCQTITVCNRKYLNMYICSESLAKRSYYAFKLLCDTLLIAPLDSISQHLPLITSCVAECCLVVSSSGCARLIKALTHKLCVLAKQQNVVTRLLEHVGTDLAALCLLCHLSAAVSRTVYMQHCLPLAIPIYMDQVLLTKHTLQPKLLDTFANCLKFVEHDQFKDKLLPTAKKAMLRSAELCVQAVTHLLHDVRIDLSVYVDTIMHLYLSLVSSSSSECRESAVSAMHALGVQCSQPQAVQTAVAQLVQQCSVKQSVLEQRLSVVQAVAVLAQSPARPLHPTAVQVLTQIQALVNAEANDVVLEMYLSCVQQWSIHLGVADANLLTATFTHNRVSASARLLVARCMLLTFTGKCAGKLVSCADVLDQSLLCVVQEALQPSAAMPLCVQAMYSATMLLRLHQHALNSGAKCKESSVDYQQFAIKLLSRPTFLATLVEADLPVLLEMLELVVLHASSVSEYNSEVCSTWMYLCCVQSVRDRAVQATVRLTSAHGYAFLSLCLTHVHTKQQLLQESIVRKKRVSAAEPVDSAAVSASAVGAMRWAVLALLHTAQQATSNERLQVMRAVLHACSTPLMASQAPNTWLMAVTRMQMNNDPQLIELVAKELGVCEQSEIECCMAQVLCTVSSEQSAVLDHVTKALHKLNVDQLLEVPLQSVHIWRHEAGQLYDTSVLDLESAALQNKNVKRESKTYSYKEQMAEMQLRKELAEKRRKEGKDIKLTAQQKEAQSKQMAIETAIRQQVQQVTAASTSSTFEQLYTSSAGVVQLMAASVRCLQSDNMAACAQYLRLLLDQLMPLLNSALLAPLVMDCWLSAVHLVMHNTVLHKQCTALAYNCARVRQAAVQLPKQWTEEPVHKQTARLLHGIFDLVFPGGHQSEDEEQEGADGLSDCEDEEQSNVLDAVVLALVQPWLMQLATEPSNVLSSASATDQTRAQSRALQLIEVHYSHALEQPVYLHVLDVCEDCERLVALLVSDNDVSVRQLVTDALLAVCCAAEAHRNTHPIYVRRCTRLCVQQLLASDALVRECALKLLLSMKGGVQQNVDERTRAWLWLAQHDTEQTNAQLASELWQSCALQLQADTDCALVMDCVANEHKQVRVAAANALLHAVQQTTANNQANALTSHLIQRLYQLYMDNLHLVPATYDDVGRPLTEAFDNWPARCGVAVALRALADVIGEDDKESVMCIFNVLVPHALSDRNGQVRALMLSAAVHSVDKFASKYMSELLPILESNLDGCSADAGDDALRQALVVMLGTLAGHMQSSDPKIRGIVAKLIETLSTPSQQVQQAVAQCLPPLVPAIRDQAKDLSSKLMCLLLQVDNYGERRGAAYGIAGLVKGLGIVALRELEIMTTLQQALKEKKLAKHREGALLALQMLCRMLGRLFEPYVVQVLPSLLAAHGDQDAHVRQAAEECSSAVMANLSAHGVKLVLPALLTALEQDSWRTKCGSIELLGAMAHCAPRQLSACLPSVVPHLLEVLGDTHIKVSSGAREALRTIASVIKNPEVQSMTGSLLDALEDPSKHTSKCLQRLLKTKFVHYMDAPSLALLMPVLTRAFGDRSTDTRRNTCHIIANILALCDQKDVEPYIEQLIPGLQTALMDPVPDIRAVSARALGAMMAAASGDLATSLTQQLIPWLKKQLVSETSSVDRSGAAQGLCEVLLAVGGDQLTQVMPDIIRTADDLNVAPHVRDGYIMMYVFLPATFGPQFKQYLNQVIPGVLQALADESEFVRESAFRAGQRLIATYCETAMPIMLPQLQAGMFNSNWRIRLASVQMLGEFLFKVSGVTGKMTTECGEDDSFGTETANKAVLRALGEQRRNQVFAALYVSRSDTAMQVRQAAGHVWKVVVSNTPRTVKEILAVLFSLLLSCLASNSPEQQQIAARCLGELVRKMGERILVDIIPVLHKGLQSEDADQRIGVCVALSEILNNTSKDVVLMYSDLLVPTVRAALCDRLANVRQAAALTFDALHNAIAQRALDEILMPMLDKLDDEEQGEMALDGLKHVVKVKSKVLLPYLVPKLTAAPVNTLALSKLAAVAGDGLSKHLERILHALLTALAQCLGQDNEPKETELCMAVLLSVNDEAGVGDVLQLLLSAQAKGEQTNMRMAAAKLLAQFCTNTKTPLLPYADSLIVGALEQYMSSEPTIVLCGIDVLNVLVKSFDQRELLDSFETFRSCVTRMAPEWSRTAVTQVPGFAHTKGVAPVVGALREGVLNGGTDVKEQAAQCLGSVIRLSTAAALKTHVIQMTGPLIRVLGDRYQAPIKVAIIKTLVQLLDKVSIQLRPFLPQLTSTFKRLLQEPTSRLIRVQSALALAHLLAIHPKADAELADVLKQLAQTDDNNVRETLLICASSAVLSARASIQPATFSTALSTLQPLMALDEESCRMAVGCALGRVLAYGSALTDSVLNDTLTEHLLDSHTSVEWTKRHTQAVALQTAFAHDSTLRLWHLQVDAVRKALLEYATSDKIPIANAGARAMGFVLLHQMNANQIADKQLLQCTCKGLNSPLNDVKVVSALVLNHLGLTDVGFKADDLTNTKMVVSALVNGTKEKNTAVRCASEEALVAVLRLRHGDQHYQTYLSAIEGGARDSLSDVYNKTLLKISKQANVPPSDLDDSYTIAVKE